MEKKRRYLCSDMPETIDFTDFLGSASMVHLFEFFVVPILTTGGDRTGLYLYSDSIRRLSCGGKAGTCRRSKRLPMDPGKVLTSRR